MTMPSPYQDGPTQSTLQAASHEAEWISELFYWMFGGAVLIWLFVVGLAIYSVLVPGRHRPRLTKMLVIGGGAVFPTVVLTSLLCFGLALLPDLHRPPPEGSLTIRVTGARWWWRIAYLTPNGESVATANEIRLPVDEPVDFKLNSEDVIHSFWIPALGGKVDMIPGRETRLRLQPTRVGAFRGVCAEYCGTAHAQMNFEVIVMPRADFDQWLENQQKTAATPSRSLAVRGSRLFQQKGCGACHTIRGTDADGAVGPDLTHLATRRYLGAGVEAIDSGNLRRWITQPHHIKPGVRMPAFQTLDSEQVKAMVAYLEQLH